MDKLVANTNYNNDNYFIRQLFFPAPFDMITHATGMLHPPGLGCMRGLPARGPSRYDTLGQR